MKVVILAGGFGTRIRGVADDLPKPMIQIGNRPILWHIMKYYSSFGFNEFVICLGFKGNTIKEYFINYDILSQDFSIVLGKKNEIEFNNKHTELDWKITLAETGLNSMTGSRIKKIKKYVHNDDYFMLTYGDGVGDINLTQLLEFHKKHKKTMTVTGVHPPGRFGEIEFDNFNNVISFNEKPQASSGRISGGFFVCNNNIFEYLDDREDLVFEIEPINKLVSEQQLSIYEHNGFWMPMDTNREFQLLNELYSKEKAPWVIW